MAEVYHRQSGSTISRSHDLETPIADFLSWNSRWHSACAEGTRSQVIQKDGSSVKRIHWLLLVILAAQAFSLAQTPVATDAAKIVQQSSSDELPSVTQVLRREVKLVAGTPIDVEVAYTVNSIDVKPGELISFRTLIPVVVDGVTVIEEGALVTARISQAKRGGHWGKAGRLAWSMQDVVAADNSRIPLAPETRLRDDKLWSLEKQTTKGETAKGDGRIIGTSHGGEVVTRAAIAGALFPPLALLSGFKRGENAVLSEGRRFVVLVGKDTLVRGISAP
jgi:hypothetical protein